MNLLILMEEHSQSGSIVSPEIIFFLQQISIQSQRIVLQRLSSDHSNPCFCIFVVH